MVRPRLRFRPPGLKPWTKIGTLGPFRGRLGLQWVIAPVVLGLILAVGAWFALVKPHGPPGAPYVPVTTLQAVTNGTIGDSPVVRVSVQGRSIDVGYISGPTLAAEASAGSCQTYPVLAYMGVVYVDASHPTPCPKVSPPA